MSKHLDMSVTSLDIIPVGGGSINDTYQLNINGSKRFFLKLNTATSFPQLFEKEKKGLEFLAKQDCILVPVVILCERNDSHQLLVLEWIDSGSRNEAFWRKFGEQLARLHYTSNDHFGFAENNYMGSLEQANDHNKNWTDFFAGCRLQPQISLARDKHLLDKSHISAFDILFKKLGAIFNIEKPSLLHGDLWSGNFMCNDRSFPVLIDPAVYFGHRSMDLGMTTLFGGFDKIFYEAYHHHYPLPANYQEQWELCNLYPLLIHLNLFGQSYKHDIEHTLKRYT